MRGLVLRLRRLGGEGERAEERRAGGVDACIIKDSLCVPPSVKLKGRVSLGFFLHREVEKEEEEAAVSWGAGVAVHAQTVWDDGW